MTSKELVTLLEALRDSQREHMTQGELNRINSAIVSVWELAEDRKRLEDFVKRIAMDKFMYIPVVLKMAAEDVLKGIRKWC